MSEPYSTIAARNRDIDRLMEDRDAALKRAEAAEAEVARLKALLEAKQPYAPKVGDVVTFWNGSVGIIKRRCKDGRGWRIENKAREEWWEVLFDSDLRPATPAERAAAGLPPEPVDAAVVFKHGEWLRGAAAYEAPAAPRVLPEHLAWIEAHAASWDGEGPSFARADEAARALLAAIARRDGGGK